MLAQSEIGITAQRQADAAAATAASAAKVAAEKKWSPSCQVHRACAAEQTLKACEPDQKAPRWSDLQFQAEALLGKTVDVQGELGLSAAGTVPSNTPCAPGTCCHSLHMNMTLTGEPTSLPLVGLSCTGDDSKLCCTVPATGRRTIARGRLAKAAGNGLAKWQLEKVTLCEIPPPEVPDH